jgi:hypothetical protein
LVGDHHFARLRRSVEIAEQRHTRLVLVVGGEPVTRATLVGELARVLSTSVVNVGRSVAEHLLGVSARHRPMTAADTATDLIRATEPGKPALVDKLELLFLPDLMLDPLKLITDSARSRVVVAVWPGNWTGTGLRYAVPSHAEFREYENPDCLVVEAPSSSTKDRS